MLENLNKALRLTLFMTFVVIVLGAYTRLKDAGLGCPDWPGCYGKLFAPSADEIFSKVACEKAWIEMIHRYVAAALSLLILYICIQGIRLRKIKPKLWIFTSCVLLLVIYQALLGMWTVTMTLNPLVVMGHLLGGITIISCLWWIFLQLRIGTQGNLSHDISYLRILTIISILAVFAQIALGGWTSANYAALVCADFPTCQGQLWPHMDWQSAFALPGAPLENTARVTIQMAHRIGALITSLLLVALAVKLWHSKQRPLLALSGLLLLLLTLQLGLGITNVLGGLPIYVSLAHSGVAVLLLLCLITILYLVNVRQQNT